jgi:hypothetical protein
MAAHPRTPVDPAPWDDVPELTKPHHAICYRDDKLITKIVAERFSSLKNDESYVVELEW